MSNPIDSYFQEKKAAPSKKKEEDQHLWNRWNDNGRRPEDLEPLMKRFNGVVGQRLKTWKATAVPEAAFKAELQTHLIKAFESYDPSKAALNTHVENRLHKAKRYNTKHQNFAYIPEGKTRFIGPIDKAQDALREELGRTPTHFEISARLQDDEENDFRKLTPAKVLEIQKARIRDIPDFAFETDPTARKGSFEDQQIQVAANSLDTIFPGKPDLHTAFNYMFAQNGHPLVTSTSAIAKKMGKTDAQVSRMKTQIGTHLKKYMNE